MTVTKILHVDTLNQNKRLFNILLLVIIGAYVYLQVYHFLAIPDPLLFPDSARYLKTTTVFSDALLPEHGVTPPVVPLIYKLLGEDINVIAFSQLVLSILSWVFLSYAVSRTMKSVWISLIAFIAILTFSLSSAISLWNGVILSESLSLSIFACFIGSWILMFEKQSLKRSLLLITASVLFALSRTAHVYLLLMLGCILGVAGLFNLRAVKRKYCLAFSVIYIVMSLLSNVSANVGTQWTVYFVDVLSTRILPDPEKREYFEKHGMPVDENLMKLEGKFAQEGNWAFHNDPNLEEFRKWLYSSGKSTYVRFLLTHPHFLITGPFEDFLQMMYGYRLIYYAPKGYSSPLGALFDYMDSPLIFPIYIFAAGILAGMNLIFAGSGKSTVSLVPIIMMLLVYPLMALVWHADSHELERHVLTFSVQARLSYILLGLFTINALFSTSSQN
ncbi:MAG: hypothetical protein C4560_07250 [Nitrospiraceae bacterium]|nr:MAG: hypothetical protein C4560_07250 [Nitrospiraceae bacterium]